MAHRSFRLSRLSLLSVLGASIAACSAASDKTGSEVAHLSSTDCSSAKAWAAGTAYSAGQNVSYNGKVYKVIQSHTSLSVWPPDIVRALFEPTDCTSAPPPPPAEDAGTSNNNPCGPGPDPVGGHDAGTQQPPPPPPPPPGGGHAAGPLPKHVLTGYWQNFNNGAKTLKLSDVPQEYDLIAVAFADADATKPGAVTFNLDSGLAAAVGGYTDAQFTQDIAALHQQGRHVIISVGGQNGTISVGDSGSASNFANSVTTLMNKYGFDGVDIDLENGISADPMAQALHQIASAGGANTIITLAPQTIDMQSTGAGYFQLALKIKDVLSIVNMQFYNSGSMLGADGKVYSQGTVDFLTGLAAIELVGGLRPDQVGFGLPASTSGAGSGYVAPSVVNAALDCIETKQSCGSFSPATAFPGFRGVMDWSISWDASNSYEFAKTIKPHLSSLP